MIKKQPAYPFEMNMLAVNIEIFVETKYLGAENLYSNFQHLSSKLQAVREAKAKTSARA